MPDWDRVDNLPAADVITELLGLVHHARVAVVACPEQPNIIKCVPQILYWHAGAEQ